MKKLLSFILVMLIIFTVLPINLFSVTAQAISPSVIKTKMDGYLAKYPAGSSNPKSNCYYFVKMMTDNILGHGLPSQNKDDPNDLNQYKFNHSSDGFKNWNCIGTLVVKDGSLTTDNLKTLLSQAQPGDIVQMGYTKWASEESKRVRSRHVMMVYSVSETGIIFYHAGSKVYFGVRQNGSDKLNGDTGKEIKWSQLKYYFCNDADGLSLYRSNKVDATNSHNSHTYYEYYENSHPHQIYKQCSCGDSFYTGGTKKIDSCSSCFPKPGASVISADKTTAYNGESVTLKWTTSSNASYYNLKYQLDGNYYNVDTKLTSKEYTYKFTSAGTYYFYVDSVNANGYTQSNVLIVKVLMHKWDYELIFTDDYGRVTSPQVGKKTNITWRFYDGTSGKRYSQIAKYSYSVSLSLKNGNTIIESFTISNKDELTFSYTFDKIGWYGFNFSVDSDDPNLLISTLVGGYSPFSVTQAETSLIPAIPQVYQKTSTSIALKQFLGYEYSKDGVNWQSSNVFNDLNPGTEYSFYQRCVETENSKPSVISEELIVKTAYECSDPGKMHVYYNSCDTNCNYCGAVRIVKHTYSDSCDTSCNVCDATRIITHTYSNNCDKSCNVCGNTRTVGAHKYSNSCDTTCNYCGAKRTIKHTYSNNCDTSCNVCKATRKITHSYKTTSTTKATLSKNGKTVKKCTVCGSKTTATIKYAKTFKLSTTSYTYNGEAKKPSVTVKDSAGKTISSKYYTVTYKNNTKVGKATVTIKMKGNYKGTKTQTFTIKPAKTTVSKLTAGKKSVTVSIKKKSTQVTGYQIQYSTSKKFTSAKTKTVSSYKTTKYTLKSLSAKKTYYVRVRTYKTVNGKKYYSGWSDYKKVKTK